LARYDSIIIGAGHNGLVCAAYLAKDGQRVIVLEASDDLGGLAANREFHPGFHTSVAHSVSHFPQQIADDLKLSSQGFEPSAKPMPTVGLGNGGNHVVIDGDAVTGAGDDDAASYQSYSRSLQRFAKALRPFWLKTMPRIGNTGLSDMLTLGRLGLNIRMLGKTDMQELLRIASLPARDLMDEHFDNELLKAALSWDGLVGAKLAPRSPNSAVLTMLYRMSGESGSAKGLVESLIAAAKAAGAEIRNNAIVDRILIDGSEDGLIATGVQLSDGEKIEADRIVSATDPKRTFLNMVGVEHLDIGFTNRIRRLRCDGYVAKLHLALSDVPKFEGLQRPNGRMIIASDMDAIEFAFDNAKYGELPDNPVMEIVVPSLQDASLAPDGKHVLSAHVMYVPYQLKGGWTDAARQQICDRAIDTLAKYAPNIREQILHKEFLTPADLERDYRVTGGHWHHTEMAMDQMLMMRPTHEAAQYSTPIPGLFLCSAGCHPGGGLMGAAGHNAAREILR
jgi:phytoene dehydrogenase-like protein